MRYSDFIKMDVVDNISPSWVEIVERFRDLIIKNHGPTHYDSGDIVITFHSFPNMTYNGAINVTLGTSDISDWPRETVLGPFKTLDDAKIAVIAKLDEAEAVLSNSMTDNDCCFECGRHLNDLYCEECDIEYHECLICSEIYDNFTDAENCHLPEGHFMF